ncbi:MAG: DivIVA domain-containing protein [Clostridia bacterium]|nr:DivIVA domain-containing protein [Clostridia bacterium]MBR2877533.1 DivIVA domain-containing protein [Clostridia bacterium]MBR2973915.1 DivIVA domain-containing protein [Clostridia bacterium]MBR3576077.1 DivIVA domain-containing protein [Clostridia bacterium]
MISPIDIEKKEFRKTAFGGYDREEIDEFMSMLLQDYRTIYMENVSLKDKVNMLSSAVTKYKSMEEVLQSTLIVAQTTSDELKSAAHDRAKLITDEAEIKAGKIMDEARQELADARNELANVKIQISSYKKQMLALLQGIVNTIENIPEDTERTDS